MSSSASPSKDECKVANNGVDSPFIEPSVTSLTSADIDPQLHDNPKQPPPPVASATPDIAVATLVQQSSQFAPREAVTRLSMRRNTVPLVTRGPTSAPTAPTGGTTVRGTVAAVSARHQRVCRYCLNIFEESENWKGSCPDAPDRLRSWIERITCLNLADGVSYHCCADSEGDYIQPCQLGASSSSADYRGAAGRCRHRRRGGPSDEEDDEEEDNDDDSDDRKDTGGGGGRDSLLERLKAWSCVCLLALCVPCLCCYPMCSLCHRACRRMRLAGGKHAALWIGPPPPPQGAGVRRDPTRNTIAGETATGACPAAVSTA